MTRCSVRGTLQRTLNAVLNSEAALAFFRNVSGLELAFANLEATLYDRGDHLTPHTDFHDPGMRPGLAFILHLFSGC